MLATTKKKIRLCFQLIASDHRGVMSASTICRNIQRGGRKMSWALNYARELLKANNDAMKEDNND